jgi:hypothetical protein
VPHRRRSSRDPAVDKAIKHFKEELNRSSLVREVHCDKTVGGAQAFAEKMGNETALRASTNNGVDRGRNIRDRKPQTMGNRVKSKCKSHVKQDGSPLLDRFKLERQSSKILQRLKLPNLGVSMNNSSGATGKMESKTSN